jgi:hypothetical protein
LPGRQARGGRPAGTNPKQQLDRDLLQMKTLLETGTQLVFVGVDVDRAPAGRGRAALPQWAALAADAEAGLPGRGDVDPIAGWAADRARLLVNGEVVRRGPHLRG